MNTKLNNTQMITILNYKIKKYLLFLSLLILASNSLFSQDYGISWKPFFLPFEIKLGTNGISVSGETSIVTPIGNVGVWADVNVSERPVEIKSTVIEKTDLLVIIRDIWSNEGDYLFKIENGANLTVVVDGRNEISIKEGKVIIDVSDGNIQSIKFKGETTYLDSRIFNLSKLYDSKSRTHFGKNYKKTSKYRNALNNYSISTNFKNNDPTLIYLIDNSQSMNESERQYWFDLYEKMNNIQIEKLYSILLKEAIKLSQIDKKYGTNESESQNINTELPTNFKPIIFINGTSFNINEVYENSYLQSSFKREYKKTFQYKNALSDFAIPSYMKENDSFLIYLIINSESMDNTEKQYWFNLVTTMNLQQVDDLFNILIKEKTKLLIIEAKYDGTNKSESAFSTALNYYSIGQTSKAMEYFEMACSITLERINADPYNYNPYWNLSWYSLFVNKPQDAIIAAKKSLELSPNKIGVKSNLALGYVLNDEFEKAKRIYLNLKYQLYDDNNTWKEVFLNDIKDLESAGINHFYFNRVKQLLNE